MSKELEKNNISKKDFLKINEDDIMFITNPGRMGDEDGITFIVNSNNEFKTYRVDGWMYLSRTLSDDEYISLSDASKQFPKWYETWKHSNEKDYKGKYKYLYMGFGNGLCVNNSIYNLFEPYLNHLIEKHLENKKEEKEDLKYAAIFDTWEKAFLNMINDKGFIMR